MKGHPVRTAVCSPLETGWTEIELHRKHPDDCFSLFPLEIDVRSRSRTLDSEFLERTTSEAREVRVFPARGWLTPAIEETAGPV
jgi:hypothetical protein